jgi:hypothetical protein
MTVTRDGEILIDVVDHSADDRFDGFSLINGGGDWTLCTRSSSRIVADHREAPTLCASSYRRPIPRCAKLFV